MVEKFRNTCPFCAVNYQGGMDLVRHICAAHDLSSNEANDIVDIQYHFDDMITKIFGYPMDIKLYQSLVKNIKYQFSSRRCHKDPVKREFLNRFDREMRKIWVLQSK